MAPSSVILDDTLTNEVSQAIFTICKRRLENVSDTMEIDGIIYISQSTKENYVIQLHSKVQQTTSPKTPEKEPKNKNPNEITGSEFEHEIDINDPKEDISVGKKRKPKRSLVKIHQKDDDNFEPPQMIKRHLEEESGIRRSSRKRFKPEKFKNVTGNVDDLILRVETEEEWDETHNAPQEMREEVETHSSPQEAMEEGETHNQKVGAGEEGNETHNPQVEAVKGDDTHNEGGQGDIEWTEKEKIENGKEENHKKEHDQLNEQSVKDSVGNEEQINAEGEPAQEDTGNQQKDNTDTVKDGEANEHDYVKDKGDDQSESVDVKNAFKDPDALKAAIEIFNMTSKPEKKSCKLPNGKFMCDHPTCGKTYIDFGSMCVHRTIHTDHRYECELCLKKYTRKDSLMKHICAKVKVKNMEQKHVCAVCEENFLNLKYLEIHMKTEHPTKLLFRCKICPNSVFRTQYKLSQHDLIVHGEKSFICPECGASFTNKVKLRYHENSHKQKKLKSQNETDLEVLKKAFHICNVCSKKYESYGGLQKHMRIHTGKLFMCELCPKSYISQDSLSQHIYNSHEKPQTKPQPLNKANGPPFICPEPDCAMSFQLMYKFRRHYRWHSGDLWTCTYCDKAFDEKHRMDQHMEAVHSNVLKYKCSDCARGFTTKSARAKHYKQTHGAGALKQQANTTNHDRIMLEGALDGISKSVELLDKDPGTKMILIETTDGEYISIPMIQPDADNNQIDPAVYTHGSDIIAQNAEIATTAGSEISNTDSPGIQSHESENITHGLQILTHGSEIASQVSGMISDGTEVIAHPEEITCIAQDTEMITENSEVVPEGSQIIINVEDSEQVYNSQNAINYNNVNSQVAEDGEFKMQTMLILKENETEHCVQVEVDPQNYS
ncbi:unnamed protein product [Owenia fusiformis]|uniref:C2H2-type domain-containing protein n=1 Tax=Owenia fusiformis TaxID=6347 RepID=A0A8S4N8F9_OWEFU|nr:unnamed protein product [Owenia fusiformis]